MKKWLWLGGLGLVFVPLVLYEAAKLPYEALADEILADAPGAERLELGIDWVGIESFPGFSFEYQTRVGSWLTHKHFQERLTAAKFNKEWDRWEYDERRAFYRSSAANVACSIWWRPGAAACMPGYRRPNCDPTYDVVLGHCSWLR